MNAILSNGFVRPIMRFEFAGGIVDTSPPTCFSNFSQNRSVKQAASFELTLLYVPGTFGEDQALVMHQLLLSSVKQEVKYQYGYIVPGGLPVWQNQQYVGIFTTYTEDLQEGWLTYKICGVAHSVEVLTPKVSLTKYLSNKQRSTKYIKPSVVAEEAIHSNDTGLKELFQDYELEIHHCDEEVEIDSIKIADGSAQQVLGGKPNADGTKIESGLVSYSYRSFTPLSSLSSSLLVSMAKAGNAWNNVMKQPFICYFDNVATGRKGKFYYGPKYDSPVSGIYTYNYGNSYIDSDVLSFNVSVDCVVAMATIGATNSASGDIDPAGNTIGTTYNIIDMNGFVPDSYNTIAGLKSSSFIAASTIADALCFPYEATMTVVGQTECNQLLDKIQVNIMFNGVPHPGLSGQYVILEINDELSDSGFTTTFRLLRDYQGATPKQDLYNNAKAAAVARTDEFLKQADYT